MRLVQTMWLAFCCLLSAAASPFLYHVDRFPYDRVTISKLCQFNREYLVHILGYRCVQPDSWDALGDAKNGSLSPAVRRKALGNLLEVIGPEAFLRGEMPPYVPFWRFTEVRVP